MDGLTLVLSRPAEQEQAFEQFLTDQQNPASPEYHHWLTPAEVGDRFGLSDADLSAITAWLQSQGLQVTWVGPSKIFIGFSGTAADVSRAFQTELRHYRVNGKDLESVSSGPMVPAALAPAIKAIHGLYTIDDEPQHVAIPMLWDSPEITASNGTHFIGPGDFYNIYNLPNGITGAGTTIGIVGRSRTNAADFDNFKLLLGSSFTDPTEVVPTTFGGVDPGPAYTAPPGSGVSLGDQSEATLDVLRAGTVAQGAHLLLVVTTQASGGIETDAQYLVNTTPVPAQVMAISFGACESAAGPPGVSFWDAVFKQAAAEGISSLVSSGDSGASGCDLAFTTPPASPAANSPSYICSSSYATCVGGTEFNDTGSQSYWGTYNGNIGTTASGYIPEGGWNESWNGTTPTVAASGGGVSSIIATPPWQIGVPGVPAANAGRYTPDVSFSASMHDPYFGCFAAGGASCVVTNGSFYFTAFAGTSAAAPSMAGIAALLDQQMGSAQGNLNPGLYQMWYGAPSAFHDVTIASSGVTICDINTPSMCNNSIPGSGGLSGGQAGYAIGTGYDEVTGLGSLNAATFVNAYASTSKIAAPTMTVNSLLWPVNQDIPVGVVVNGSGYSPMPSGSIVLAAGSYTSPATPIVNGDVYVTIPAGSLAMGSYTTSATYTPDAASSLIYLPATATGKLTVTAPEYISPVMVISPSSSTITSTEPITVSVSVRGGYGHPIPTGTVTMSGGYSSGPVTLVPGNGTLADGEATFNIPAGSLAVGVDTLTITYIPDAAGASLYQSTSGSYSITNEGARITPSVQLGVSYPDITTAQPLTVTVNVNGFTGNPTPTGTVVVAGGNYTSVPASLSNGTASMNIAAGALAVGSDQLTATYTPDTQSASFYTGGSASNWVAVSLAQKIIPSVTLTQITPNPTTTQPLSMSVSVDGGSGNPTPTGSVSVGSDYTIPVSGNLIGGITTVTFPPGAFPGGLNTIKATYYPTSLADFYYDNATGTVAVTLAKAAPTVTVTPSATSVSTQQSMQVTTTVSGGAGAPQAGGTVTLTCGTFTSNPVYLDSNGTATTSIPAGLLGAGTYTLNAAYAGDRNYNSATGSTTVAVTLPAGAGFGLSATNLDLQKGSTIGNWSTVTVTPTNGFVGAVTLSAAITSSPTGAQYPPTLSFGNTSPVNLVGFNEASARMTITSTPATTGAVNYPVPPGARWYASGGGALACVLIIFAPLKRRRLKALGMLAMLAVLGSAVSCGGGSSVNTGGGGGGSTGTTSGQYTITITGTNGSMTANTTMTLTVH